MKFFALCRIQILDLDPDGPAEVEAKSLLRTTILYDPNDTNKAWDSLVLSCERMSAKQSGADRHSLQQGLITTGINLRAPRSYREDIRRLKELSSRNIELLAHLSHIHFRGTEVKIRRPATQELLRIAETDSIIVVGQPGAGKSGALHDLAESLQQEDRDLLFLAADRISGQSLGEIQKELCLDHSPFDIFENWPGRGPAFLIIDALDSMRGEPAGRTVRDLIRGVLGLERWRVIASIRKFDLRYSHELKQLFRGIAPGRLKDPEFANVVHLEIPVLEDDEIGQIAEQSADFYASLISLPKGLREIVFNMRLLAEILEDGCSPKDLPPIYTQLQLLDLYWTYRVIREDGQADAREAVLKRACEKMVTARQLHSERIQIAPETASQVLDDVLRNHILVEWQPSATERPQRHLLAFSHNVLFDYAVSRLLLRVPAQKLVRLFTDDPDLVLTVRPSLAFHFHHLWFFDSTDIHREAFWDLAFKMIGDRDIPEIGKLVGPSVAVESARALSDLDPLCTGLEEYGKLIVTEIAERALLHVVNSVLAGRASGFRIVGLGAGPWCVLAGRISRSLQVPLAYYLRTLLSCLCEQPELLTDDQREAAGNAARKLLEFAWGIEPRNGWLITHAIQYVCRTFEADPMASSMLLRRALAPTHLRAFGYEELPWLAREVPRLITVEPALVEEIYRTAFAHQEESKETTDIGTGQILALTSNRKQDYDMALYELADKFKEFLQKEPERATGVLIAVLEAYVDQKHGHRGEKEIEETFAYGNAEARILSDFSLVWDSTSVYRHDEPMRMLDTFETYLRDAASNPSLAGEREAILSKVILDNRLAVLWCRLLRLGAKYPETIGRSLISLLWAIPILTCRDTTVAAGEFLKVAFPRLETEERHRVEAAILSIPKSVLHASEAPKEHMRNRLLGCLDTGYIVTTEARTMVEELQRAGKVHQNEPLVRFESGWSKPYDEKGFLEDEGVPVNDPVNRRIRDLESPLNEFIQNHLNTIPNLDEIIRILPSLGALKAALSGPETKNIHPKQQEYGWGTLADACSKITRSDDLSKNEEAGILLREILVAASKHPEPLPSPDADSQFDHPHWGMPAPRVSAAEGLILLAKNEKHATPEVLGAIKALANDQVPAVRFQIAHYLNTLYRTAPDLMWSLVEQYTNLEKSSGVLQGFLCGPIDRLLNAYPDRIVQSAISIFERIRENADISEVRRICLQIFSGLYVWRGDERCNKVVKIIAENPAADYDAAHDIICRLSNGLTHGPAGSSDPEHAEVRRRAFGIIASMLAKCRETWDYLSATYKDKPFRLWPTEEQAAAKSVSQIVDSIGTVIFAVSGAIDERKSGQEKAGENSILEVRKRFYYEVGSILDQLAGFGLARLAHHLLQTLEVFIPIDPKSVFLRIESVVQNAAKGGYQYESLAADLMVRLVKRYLADYRPLLREDKDCRNGILRILDVFVIAGWPSAHRLSYKLEEIYR